MEWNALPQEGVQDFDAPEDEQQERGVLIKNDSPHGRGSEEDWEVEHGH